MGEEPRTAKDIIDQAIRENRMGEYVLYFAAVLLMLTGLSLLGWAIVFSRELVSALVGIGVGSLSVPPMKFAKRIRGENIAIRLLERPLNRANTADEAARVLATAYSELFDATKRLLGRRCLGFNRSTLARLYAKRFLSGSTTEPLHSHARAPLNSNPPGGSGTSFERALALMRLSGTLSNISIRLPLNMRVGISTS
jgi:hypothetical protein